MTCLLLLCALGVADAKKPPADPAPPTEAPPAPVEAPKGPRTVTAKEHLVDAAGVRATVIGTLKRVEREGVEATAVVLEDGTPVFVSQGAPPEGWAWMLDTRIRVQGKLYQDGSATGGWPAPTLTELDTPMPADAGMPGMGL